MLIFIWRAIPARVRITAGMAAQKRATLKFFRLQAFVFFYGCGCSVRFLYNQTLVTIVCLSPPTKYIFKKRVDFHFERSIITVTIIIIDWMNAMALTKRSRQREAILSELRGRTDHPTAEELYFTLKENMPSLSLGTVYRNLSLLSEEGMILKLSCGGADHFDGNTAQHYHFLCKRCDRLYDLPMPVLEELDRQAQKCLPCSVDHHRLTFYGTCQGCTEER